MLSTAAACGGPAADCGWVLAFTQLVLPALMHLLVPPLRPVAANLQSAEERATLASLTDTMLAYNLRYEAAACGPLPAADAPPASMAATPLLPAVDALCNFEVCFGIS
jgi:hypothetical protein